MNSDNQILRRPLKDLSVPSKKKSAADECGDGGTTLGRVFPSDTTAPSPARRENTAGGVAQAAADTPLRVRTVCQFRHMQTRKHTHHAHIMRTRAHTSHACIDVHSCTYTCKCTSTCAFIYFFIIMVPQIKWPVVLDNLALLLGPVQLLTG